jgi:translation initiation factor 1A
MPKHSKKQKNAKNRPSHETKRPLVTRDMDGQEYARVTKLLGNRRVECFCYDGETRIGHIRGNMKRSKSTWVGLDDIVLIGLRDFQDRKADILLKYTSDEIRQLEHLGELPSGSRQGLREGLEDSKEVEELVFEEVESEDICLDAI